METKRFCSQEPYLAQSSMLGKMHLFHFHTFLCLVQSSTKRKTCHRFWGNSEIPSILAGISCQEFLKRIVCPSWPVLPRNRGQLWKVSKHWLQEQLDLWSGISPADADIVPIGLSTSRTHTECWRTWSLPYCFVYTMMVCAYAQLVLSH